MSLTSIDHLSLSVTDLERSEAFYTDVLGLTRLMDFGEVRVLIDPASSFRISLVLHAERSDEPFSELRTGLDHIGLTAQSREELEAWVVRFDAAGVTYSPIQDQPFGHHLNFRDPDSIPLEFYVPADVVTQGYARLREGPVSRQEIDAYVQQAFGAAGA